ncbi:MAG: hypothetical protein RI896_1558 [Pseudomonadota bacterium]
MGHTFKAAVAMPNGTIEIQNFQTPDPKPDAGLLKVGCRLVEGGGYRCLRQRLDVLPRLSQNSRPCHFGS